MKFLYASFLLASALLLASAQGYRILCLFPFNGKSHFVMFDALCNGLARKGHTVHMISHFPSKTPRPNYTDIVDLSGTRERVVNNLSVDYAKNLQKSIVYYIATTFGYDLCELMGHEKMQKFIQNPPKEPYDLVITEYFGASCYLGFGHFLKAPVAIALSSMDMPYLNEALGNPLSDAFFPGMYMDNAVVESFWDRLLNFVKNFQMTRTFVHYTDSQTEIMRKYLGQDVPDIRQVERDVSLALVNTHHTFHGIRPMTPAMVYVGGLHVEEDTSKLTPELEKWLDEARNGVVYFTLGSLINIETLPEPTILDLYASFGKIAPVKVLMKCANDTRLPPGLPRNVLTLPWIPQIPVLRHKNTRVFITHGGLMGSQEALHYGIPMIGIPVFADQPRNVNIFVRKRMAVSMNIEDINEKTMDAALDAVLNDPQYTKSAKRESALFRDRPMSPMDTAVYWVEYVIRNGPKSLRSPAVDMYWWQLRSIDVLAFLLACVLIALYLTKILLKVLLVMLFNDRVKSTIDEKKRK